MTVAFSPQKQHGCRFTHDVTGSQHNHFLTGNSYACPLHKLQYARWCAGHICWQSNAESTHICGVRSRPHPSGIDPVDSLLLHLTYQGEEAVLEMPWIFGSAFKRSRSASSSPFE